MNQNACYQKEKSRNSCMHPCTENSYVCIHCITRGRPYPQARGRLPLGHYAPSSSSRSHQHLKRAQIYTKQYARTTRGKSVGFHHRFYALSQNCFTDGRWNCVSDLRLPIPIVPRELVVNWKAKQASNLTNRETSLTPGMVQVFARSDRLWKWSIAIIAFFRIANLITSWHFVIRRSVRNVYCMVHRHVSLHSILLTSRAPHVSLLWKSWYRFFGAIVLFVAFWSVSLIYSELQELTHRYAIMRKRSLFCGRPWSTQ